MSGKDRVSLPLKAGGLKLWCKALNLPQAGFWRIELPA